MSTSSSMHYQPESSGQHPLRVTKDPGIIKVNNETAATSSRITREGRRIIYKTRIIQQPNRARACGSGAKSCADRRPVDPPPIIELRIFEGQGDQEVDITWEYNANFFVFATLEHARHIATGRVPNSAQNNVPVLTGSPVAGMALLERPQKAGYFIFPDLSVRHEGKYRLNFSLYEELKNQADMDSETANLPAAMNKAHVSHRLEVKTVPFTVFSAKKFPGLTSSTPLSIAFAEQGCRVRIRRDIRMRQRHAKPNFDADEEQYYGSRRPSIAPDQYHPDPNLKSSRAPSVDHMMDRPRAGSVASVHSNILARRPSDDQMQQQYAHQSPYISSAQTAQDMYARHSQWPEHHLQHQQPQHQSQPQPYAPQHQHGYSPHPPHHSYPPPPPQAMAPPSYSYPSHYPQESQHSRNNSMEYPPVHPHPVSPRSVPSPNPHHQISAYGGFSAPSYSSPNYGSSHQYVSPTQPIHSVGPTQFAPLQPSPRNDSVHQPVVPVPPSEHIYNSQPQQQPQPPQQQVQHSPAPVNGVKRDYGSSFDTRALSQPLRDGARPSVGDIDVKYNFNIDASTSAQADDDLPMDISAMSYRRADGTFSRRTVAVLD